MQSPPSQPTRPRIHLIANSHIDPVWLWDRYEGIDEVINTFRSACDRLDEYPSLRFTASSITFYKWVEEYAPEVFERIRDHVHNGRWEITGGWLVETDCNLPTEASFRKSAELSGEYVADRFGMQTPVAYSPDSFGHAATLPRLLAETGFKYYFFTRPQEYEKNDLPGNLFYWQYEDSRVLCYRLKYHYSQGARLAARIESALADEAFLRHGAACYFFGVGDHGGGPTKDEIDFLVAKQGSVQDTQLLFSTCLEFMREAEKLPDIPVYEGDLHMHAVGCYSINRELKQSIRSAEHGLEYVQRLLDASGASDSRALDGLWEKTIFNQFHDIMPGSCAPRAAAQAIAEMGGVRDEIGWTGYRRLKGLSTRMPVACPEGEFRIFNSLPQPITGPFEIESFAYFRDGAPFMDGAGREIPIQWITPSVNCFNRRWLFVDTIPAQTMKSYCFGPGDSSGEQNMDHRFLDGDRVTAGKYTVTAPGTIADSSSNLPLLSSPIRLGVVPDDSDTWSHGLSGYGEAEAYFEPVSSSVNLGPLASFLLVRQEYRKSTAEMLFTVYEDLPFTDLSINIFWGETRNLLKMEVKPTASFQSPLVCGPGGTIAKRREGREEPLHGWLLTPGLGIVQDGAFAFDAPGGLLRITLVRSCLYAYDLNTKIDPLGPLTHTDLQQHSFRFRFFFDDGLTADDVDKLHAALIEPFSVIRENK
ncbi:MAG: hypothetical protein Q7T82_07820 [Armatimonadota bacterium]|nr:hypothetical protein [Armatimonadota bacterium]